MRFLALFLLLSLFCAASIGCGGTPGPTKTDKAPADETGISEAKDAPDMAQPPPIKKK